MSATNIADPVATAASEPEPAGPLTAARALSVVMGGRVMLLVGALVAGAAVVSALGNTIGRGGQAAAGDETVPEPGVQERRVGDMVPLHPSAG